MKKDLLKQAFETIAFQNGNFGKELELLISELRKNDVDASKAKKLPILKSIEKFVLDRIGLNIKIEVDTPIFAAIELPLINLNHIFFSDFLKEFSLPEVTKNLKKIKNKEKVIIDVKNSKITGPTTGVVSNVYLSWNDFLKKSKFLDEEVTAIFLHELGHAWTTIEYLDRLSTTNEALLTVCDAFLNGDKQLYEIELNKVSKKLFNKEEVLSNLKDVTDLKVISSVILTTELKTTKSDLGTPYYDSVNCEYLADQFVSRHQYGKYLVSGLDKLYGYFNPEKNIGMSILTDVVAIVLFGVVTYTMILGSPLAIMFGIFHYYLVFVSNKITNGEPSYDNLKNRYRRILDQLVLDLKNKHYSKEQIKDKLDAFDKVNTYIENTLEKDTVFKRILTLLLPGETKAKKGLDLQKDLEELASNKLFIQSAKLKTILQ